MVSLGHRGRGQAAQVPARCSAPASSCVVNKIDLLPHLDFDLDRCSRTSTRCTPASERMLVSARTGEGVDAWREWLAGVAAASGRGVRRTWPGRASTSCSRRRRGRRALLRGRGRSGSRASAARSRSGSSRGGRLLAVGGSPQDRSDAHHVAVEFVHPVIVGKRALPALARARRSDRRRCSREPDDAVIAFGPAEPAPPGCLTIAFGAGARVELRAAERRPVRPRRSSPRRSTTCSGSSCTSSSSTSAARARAGAGASGVPLPVPRAGRSATSTPVVERRRARSVLMKARGDRRAARADARRGGDGARWPRRPPRSAQSARRGRQAARLRQRRLGDRRDGPRRRPAGRAAGLAAPRGARPRADAAILTALANDIGPEALFQRQVIAYGREGDVALALSTSGGSANIVEALAEARQPRPRDDRARRLRRRPDRGRAAWPTT